MEKNALTPLYWSTPFHQETVTARDVAASCWQFLPSNTWEEESPIMIHNASPLKFLPSLCPCPTAPACHITYCFSAKHGPRPPSGCKLCCTKPLRPGLHQQKRANISRTYVSGHSGTGCISMKTHSSVKKLIDDVSR